MIAQGVATSHAAEFTGISRRTLYTIPRTDPICRPRPDEAEVRRAVRRVALSHPTYGVRRVHALLRHEGLAINRKRVHRLLHAEGLTREPHFPRPRLPSTGALTAPLPNLRWYTDITYVETTDRGPCALTSILDACTREVLAHSFLPHCGASEAFQVLEAAVRREFPRTMHATDVIVRADGGAQFTSQLYRERARLLGITVEAIRKKRPEDNGMVESYHGKLKMDYLWVREPTTYLETRGVVDDAIRHWNVERPHSSLGYLTPSAYAKKLEQENTT